MKPPPTTTWVCPVCGRRVPRREAECFCGARQAQVEARVVREAARTGQRVPWDVAGLLLMMVLVGAYGVHRLMAPDDDEFGAKARRAFAGLGSANATPLPAPPPSRTAPRPALAPSTAPRIETPPPTTEPAAEPPRALPAAPAAAIAPAAPSPSASPDDERERARAAGLQRYQAELGGLQETVNQLAEHVRVYKAECASAPRVGSMVSNCDQIEAAIRSRSAEIQRALDGAEDRARQAWVSPGAVRDIRARSFFGTRAWEDLQRSAAAARRP